MKIKTIHYEQGSFNEEGKARRSKAKGINLGLNYGLGTARLAQMLDVEFDEAQKIMTDFFSTYQNVSHWREFNHKKMETYGFMETIFGRRRRLPDVFLKSAEVKVYDDAQVDNIFPNILGSTIKVENQQLSEEATTQICAVNNWKKKDKLKQLFKDAGYKVIDNGAFLSRTNTQCTNAVIQGSAADMTKLAMIEIHEDPILRKYGAKLRFLVHDEILIEAPIEHRDEVEKEFVNCMVRAPKDFCKVAMICDAELETRWKQGHTCGKIKKLYEEKGREAVYNKYIEFNKDDLDRVIDGTFDSETEILRVR